MSDGMVSVPDPIDENAILAVVLANGAARSAVGTVLPSLLHLAPLSQPSSFGGFPSGALAAQPIDAAATIARHAFGN